MIKQGISSKDIGRLLGIDRRGVESHRTNIRRKLGLNSRGANLATHLRSL